MSAGAASCNEQNFIPNVFVFPTSGTTIACPSARLEHVTTGLPTTTITINPGARGLNGGNRQPVTYLSPTLTNLPSNSFADSIQVTFGVGLTTHIMATAVDNTGYTVACTFDVRTIGPLIRK